MENKGSLLVAIGLTSIIIAGIGLIGRECLSDFHPIAVLVGAVLVVLGRWTKI